MLFINNLKLIIMTDLTINTTVYSEIYCRTFFDVDLGYGGIEVYEFEGGDRIGSMVSKELPDENDEDELDNFKIDLENWLLEQGF